MYPDSTTSPPAPGPSLVWCCHSCGNSISPLSAGYSQVDRRKIHAYEKAFAEWERRVDEANAGRRLQVIPGDLLLDAPMPVAWTVTCKACDPAAGGGNHYWISLDRAATWPDVAEWTAHLLGKTWFVHTRWSQLLRDLIGWNGGAA